MHGTPLPSPLPAAQKAVVIAVSKFFGWYVVWGTFVVLLLGFGTAYSFAAFFEPLKREFQATRGQLSLVFAITGFLYFGLGAVSGPLADRVGPRRVVLAGVAMIVGGLLAASRAQTLWQVYLTYSLGVGVGVGFVYVPAVGAVQRWFVRRRGFASGIAVAGIGVGTLVMPPLSAWLIERTDWRTTYVILALLVLTAGSAAALMVEHSPARRGQLPDGDRATSWQGVQPVTGMTVREAVRSRPFALLTAATVATSLGLFIPFAHLAPYARDHGLSEKTGAVLVGLIGIGSSAGRLCVGGLADRFGRRRSLVLAYALMSAMLMWWLMTASALGLALFALGFGVGYGGFVALLPALIADYFGGKSVGGIIGLVYTGAAVGALAGPSLAGVIFDLLESYTLPILIGVAANIGAVVCVVALAEPELPAASQLRAGDGASVPEPTSD